MINDWPTGKTSSNGSMNQADLINQIRELRPWHHNLQLTPEVDIRCAFEPDELARANNGNVSFIDVRDEFVQKIADIYPEGFAGKTFLDCACNSGAYCFWVRELGAKQAFGFDVREHWIDQARFISRNRTVAPTDQIEFDVFDLMQLREKDIEPADLTLFKGIFYHLADPIQGLKIAADLTKDVLWFNSAVIFKEDERGLICTFERSEKVMSGVHSLSWTPTGPKVIVMMLHWLGFTDIWHVYTRPYPDGEYGRMEIIASRTAGRLDGLANIETAVKMPTSGFRNAVVANEQLKSLF
jgi:SAM-dependent methyltransferase